MWKVEQIWRKEWEKGKKKNLGLVRDPNLNIRLREEHSFFYFFKVETNL